MDHNIIPIKNKAIVALKELLGYTNIASTELNVHPPKGHLQDVVDRAPRYQ